MANPLLGYNQPPAIMQTLLGANYDPRQQQMQAILGAIGGFGRGLLNAKAGPYLTDAGVLNSAGQGMNEGYQQANDDYMRQAMGAYEMQQAEQDRERKLKEWQQEQEKYAQQQERYAEEQKARQAYQTQIDADPSLSPQQKTYLKANPQSPYYGKTLFPDPQQDGGQDGPKAFAEMFRGTDGKWYQRFQDGSVQPIRDLPDGVEFVSPYQTNFDKAKGTEMGKVSAETQTAAPGQLDDIKMARGLLEKIKTSDYLDRGTGFSSYGNAIPGTGGYDFQNMVDQAKSGAFLSAIQKMRGMGALSNQEGSAATAAITRMNTATSREAFIDALNDYENYLNLAEQRVLQRAGIQQQGNAGGGTKTYTFNPATGELE